MYDSQYGFREHHSTKHAVYKWVDRITNKIEIKEVHKTKDKMQFGNSDMVQFEIYNTIKKKDDNNKIYKILHTLSTQ